MSSVPKSLGVMPPFVLQYDPSNAPVIQIAVYGGGLAAAQLYDYAANDIEPLIEGIPGVASASPERRASERQINVIVDPAKAAARGVTSSEVAKAVERSNALLPSGRFNPPSFSANVYTNAVPSGRRRHRRRGHQARSTGRPVLHQGRRPHRGRGHRKDAKPSRSTARTRSTSTCSACPAATSSRSSTRSSASSRAEGPARRASRSSPSSISRPSCAPRSTGSCKEVLQALVLIGVVILLFLQSPRSVLIAAIAIPVSFAIILHRPLRDRADAQRLHAGRPDARHGAARRHLGRRPRVRSTRHSIAITAARGAGRRRRSTAPTPSPSPHSPRRSRPSPCSCRCCCSTAWPRSSSSRSRSPSRRA